MKNKSEHYFLIIFSSINKRVMNFDFVCNITKTRLYNFDPLKPQFYIVKLGFTGAYIIFLILQ